MDKELAMKSPSLKAKREARDAARKQLEQKFEKLHSPKAVSSSDKQQQQQQQQQQEPHYTSYQHEGLAVPFSTRNPQEDHPHDKIPNNDIESGNSGSALHISIVPNSSYGGTATGTTGHVVLIDGDNTNSNNDDDGQGEGGGGRLLLEQARSLIHNVDPSESRLVEGSSLYIGDRFSSKQIVSALFFLLMLWWLF